MKPVEQGLVYIYKYKVKTSKQPKTDIGFNMPTGGSLRD